MVAQIIRTILAALIIVLTSTLPAQDNQQQIDPFYLQRLEAGERAFLEGNYKTAVEELNIALFGIQENEQLRAKAYVFLGMSQYYLNDNDQTRKYLNDAINILGIDGLRDLISDESVWFYLERLLIEFKLLEPAANQPAGTVIPPRNPAQKDSSSPPPIIRQRNLEKQILSEPLNVDLYYALYEHHMQNEDLKSAKKTLENLIKNNPDEAKGYFILGKMQYQERDLKQAEENLAKVSQLQEKVKVEEHLLLEAKIYEILTVLLRGDKDRAYKMYADWAIWLTEERMRYLELDGKDRAIFQGIVESNKLRPEPGVPLSEKDPAEISESASIENSGIENVVPLEEVDTPPVLLEKVDPVYPESAAKLGLKGQVIARLLISESGDVLEVLIIQGLAGGFNEETVKALGQWKYEPAVKDRQRVKVWKQVTITFKGP